MRIDRHFRLDMRFPSHGPVVCANLIQPVEFIPRAQRVYLLDPADLSGDTTRILGRTHHGRMDEHRVPWVILENVRVESVPWIIAKLCSQSEKPTVEKWADDIRKQKVMDLQDWSVSID